MLTIIFQRRYIIITLFWFCRIKISEFQKIKYPTISMTDTHFSKKGLLAFCCCFGNMHLGVFFTVVGRKWIIVWKILVFSNVMDQTQAHNTAHACMFICCESDLHSGVNVNQRRMEKLFLSFFGISGYPSSCGVLIMSCTEPVHKQTCTHWLVFLSICTSWFIHRGLIEAHCVLHPLTAVVGSATHEHVLPYLSLLLHDSSLKVSVEMLLEQMFNLLNVILFFLRISKCTEMCLIYIDTIYLVM